MAPDDGDDLVVILGRGERVPDRGAVGPDGCHPLHPRRSRSATSSATGGSHASRWQWVSITASGGSGLGLDPREELPELADLGAALHRAEDRALQVELAAEGREQTLAEVGMNGCSSTETTRSPSASVYSTWSR